MTTYRCDHLFGASGWVSPGELVVEDGRSAVERVRGYALPGMPNLHSHAFQRAIAGLTEYAGPGGDDFWSWRDAMYRFALRVEPDELESLACQLYVEMLEAGYTAVCEFHYLHHAPDGSPYDNPVEMSERLVAAARRAGIRLTLLPALYASGGFDGAPLGAAQRRFRSDAAWVMRAVERLRRAHPEVRVGVAPHSLRAAPPAELAACVTALEGLDSAAPIHIHVAEQTREVDACLTARGARPVEWLLASAPVDERWCLVHATHVTSRELADVARAGAVIGFCPTTEANLGDGLGPAGRSGAAGVRFGVGSDSQISVSVREELRWLEYTARLERRARNVLAPAGAASTGAYLYSTALAGGLQALAQPGGRDLVVLDPEHPVLAERPLERVLDAHLFSNHGSAVRDVMVDGEWVVKDGRHREREAIRACHRRALARLAE
ncbi:MAG: formimidoylglutamate deiminase [Sorangiineae bacterium]|nr:formimidoylglutamate deiminase [Polyangiaceae bacterium]MEB2321023.1 formimidoylglutamate deiminase [Sorangiineae bacterium]